MNKLRKYIKSIIYESFFKIEKNSIKETSLFEVRQLIYQKLNEVSDRMAGKPTTRKFDHLKWKLTHEQKQFLDDFININEENIRDQDLQYASKRTGIPVQNIISIRNTLSDKTTVDEKKNDYGRLVIGVGKPITAPEVEFDPKWRHDVVNFKKISKEEVKKKRFPTLNDKREKDWKVNGDKPYLITRSFWAPQSQQQDEDLMEYIKDRMAPKKIIKNLNGKIQIDQEPTSESLNRTALKVSLDTNKKDSFYLKVEQVVNEYNTFFGCQYHIIDHLDLTFSESKCHRTFIEIKKFDVNKMIWSSEDKKWLPYHSAPELVKQEYHKKFNLPMPNAQSVDHEKLLQQYKDGSLNQKKEDNDTRWLY